MNHTKIYPPLVTALLYETYNNKILPEKLYVELTRQSKKRRKLLECIDRVWNSEDTLIDISNYSKINDTGQIKNIIALYTRLSDFIESDQKNRRIILYLPFEILPGKSFYSSSKKLNQVVKHFVEVYLKTWRHLLESIDLRVNFSNGDIIDSEFQEGISPLVIKAAHLIPVLVQKDLLTIKEVSELLEKTDDPVLIDSIMDSFGVLVDMGLVSSEDLAKMQTSYGVLAQHIKTLLSGKKNSIKNCVPSTYSIEASFKHQSIELQKADVRFPRNVPMSAQNKWERGDAIEKIMEYTSELMLNTFKNSGISIKELIFLITEKQNPEIVIPILLCIRKVCEDLQQYDLETTHYYIQCVLPVMKMLHRKYSVDIDECIEISLYHWCNLGMVNSETMIEFGLEPRNLRKNISTKNIFSLNQKDQVKKITQSIRDNSVLSHYFYPIVIIYGSKVKGYALNDTDNDIAFFIKPEIPFSDRNKIQKMLSDILMTYNIQATPLEVWLEEKNYSLQIRDMGDESRYIAQSSMVYILFQSIWIGDVETVHNLYQRLVVPYLTNEYRHKNSNREIWVREMERDMLQYRLLHKGYARFYPTKSPFIGEHVDDITGKSTFWDSGYRKVATRLFISNVYLPLLNY